MTSTLVSPSAGSADPAVDVVYVATPNAAHAAEVKAAAAAGKHVLSEKPLATSVEDAREAVEACKAAGVKLGVDRCAYGMLHQTRRNAP